MSIRLGSDGTALAIYSDEIAALMAAFGSTPNVRRASHVEPDGAGGWVADLAPVGGPALGPFTKRAEALAAEVDYLNRRVIGA